MPIRSQFDPITHTIDPKNQRLCIKNGKLFVENVSKRKNASFLSRLFTRGDYSQSAILTKMNRLYQLSEKNNTLTPQFTQNYHFLVTKADQQNQRYQNIWSVIRFFKAKTHIDTVPHHTVLAKLPSVEKNPIPVISKTPEPPLSKIVTPPVVTPTSVSDWWGEGTPDEDVLSTTEFAELACYRAADLLKLIHPDFIIQEQDNTPKNFQAMLVTLGLSTIGDFMKNGLNTREKFVAYLQTNAPKLSRLIRSNHFDIVKG